MKQKSTRIKITSDGLRLKNKILEKFKALPKTKTKKNKEEIIIEGSVIDDKFLVVPIDLPKGAVVNPYGIGLSHMTVNPPPRPEETTFTMKFIKSDPMFFRELKESSFFIYQGFIWFKKCINGRTIRTYRVIDDYSFHKFIEEREKEKRQEDPYYDHKDIQTLKSKIVITPIKMVESVHIGLE